MRGRSHIRLFLFATCVWAGFLVGGLPSYYQQYSTATMVIFDLVVLVPITGVVCSSIPKTSSTGVFRDCRVGTRFPLRNTDSKNNFGFLQAET